MNQGHNRAEVEDALKVIVDVATDAIEALGQQSPDFPLLLVGRKSCGELFTCEMSLVHKHHAQLGWSYLIGLQKNSSAVFSVMRVLKAAMLGRDNYVSLCQQALLPGWSNLPEGVDEHCSQVMLRKWREALAEKITDLDPACKSKIQEHTRLA